MRSARQVVPSSLVVVVLVALGACGPAPESVVVRETDIATKPMVGAETAVATKTMVATESTVAADMVVTSPAEPADPVPTEPVPAAESEGLWYPINSEPETLDFHNEDAEALITGQCIEGLFEYRGDGAIEPTGATGFEVSDDGRLYTVSLRKDAVWSDGVPVVAQHFVDGIIRLLDPETVPGYAALVYDIEGAEAYNRGEVGDPATVGVRAVDDHTLEIRLAKPVSHFEAIMPSASFYPVRLDITEKHGSEWTEAGNYLCNGAYLLDEWVHGKRLVLVKNPAYWNASGVSIERITLPIIPERAEIWAMYQNDELYVYDEGDLRQEAQRFLSDPVLSQEYRVLPMPGVVYFGLNTKRPPTDDVRVRQALALAIDHETFLAEMTWDPEFLPPSCTIPPNIMGHQPYGTCGHAYDPERARELLTEAGYPDGEGFPPLQRWAHYGTWQTDALETVARMWEETLGITTEAHVHDWDLYLDYLDGCITSQEALAACDLHAYVLAWTMDYGDPKNILEDLFAPSSTYHYTGWENDRYEELMALAATEYDAGRRAEYYKEADKILVERETVVIPILTYRRPALIKEGMTFEYPPFGPPRFKHWALP